MTEEKKKDIETAEVVVEVKEKETPRQLEPDCWIRLKDRMVYIYGILVLDFFVVFFAYGVYNSRMFEENKGWQEMFLLFYKITFIFGVMATLSEIFDADKGSKASFFICYVAGIFCCLFMTVLPFLFYCIYTCYTALVPWLSSGPLGGLLQVIWGLRPASALP